MSHKKLMLIYTVIAISIAVTSSAITAGLMKNNASYVLSYSNVLADAEKQSALMDCPYPDYRLARNTLND